MKFQSKPQVSKTMGTIPAESNEGSMAGWMSNGLRKDQPNLNILTGMEKGPQHANSAGTERTEQVQQQERSTGISESSLASAIVAALAAMAATFPTKATQQENPKQNAETTTKRKHGDDSKISPKRTKDMPIENGNPNKTSALTRETEKESPEGAGVKQTSNRPKKTKPDAAVANTPDSKHLNSHDELIPRLRIVRNGDSYAIDQSNTSKTDSIQPNCTEETKENETGSTNFVGESSRSSQTDQLIATEGARILSTRRVDFDLGKATTLLRLEYI